MSIFCFQSQPQPVIWSSLSCRLPKCKFFSSWMWIWKESPYPKNPVILLFWGRGFCSTHKPFLSMLVTVNDFCFWREKTPYDVLLDYSENLCIPGIPSPCKDGQTFCCMFLITFRLLTMFVFLTWVCLRSWFLILDSNLTHFCVHSGIKSSCF